MPFIVWILIIYVDKGRCNREKPPCKYFHPPQHLKDQLLINGRNHLALKNALMQQMGLTPGQPLVPGQVQAVAANPYLTGMPQVSGTYSPYFAPAGPLMPTIMGAPGDPTAGVGSPLGVVAPQTVVAQQKMPRSDRLEVCREFQRGACKRPEGECRFAHPPETVAGNEDGTVTVCMDAVKGRCNRDPCRYFHPPLHLQAQIKAAHSKAAAAAAAAAAVAAVATATAHATSAPVMDMKSVGSFYYENFAFPAGMVPYKRPAADKSGVPVYQPNATTYQQLMQLQQPFVPVSCEYPSSPGTPNANTASVTTMATTNAPPPPQHPPPSASASPPLQQPAAPSTPKEDAQQQLQQQQLQQQQQQLQQQQQQYQQQLQQVPPPPPSHSAPPPMHPDPAALAKEVAQQNYAKAIKLAAMNQQLNPLNYTGVSLNKQMVAAAAATPQPAAAAAAAYPRYPATLPFQFQAGGLSHLGLANPYQAALAQQNLLNLRSQAQPNFQINPYSLIRPQYMTAAAPAQYQLLQQQAQYPVAVSAAPMTTATPSGSIAVAAAQNNNNNVVLQPYKKLKTT